MILGDVDLRIIRPIFRWGIAAFLIAAPAAGQESYNFTTYYPSPSGVYKRMVTTADTNLARDGGKVGINMGKGNNPAALLDVGGDGLLHVAGTVKPTTAVQGAYLGWNALTKGTGETDFINNQGGGSAGGFAFMNTPPSGSPIANLAVLTGSGNLGIGVTNPTAKIQIGGTAGVDGIKFPDSSVQTTAAAIVYIHGEYIGSIDCPPNSRLIVLSCGYFHRGPPNNDYSPCFSPNGWPSGNPADSLGWAQEYVDGGSDIIGVEVPQIHPPGSGIGVLNQPEAAGLCIRNDQIIKSKRVNHP